uniref:RNA-directed RNA polymerase n=1 Tax=Apple barna-like virus 1 TaxID=2709742 RepID=A0A6C0X2I8_9VIRU|nr:MAG: RNA-dependent RNA polymerase [Apple barna-like virus 1]
MVMGRSNKILLDDPLMANMLVEEALWRVRKMVAVGGRIFSMSPEELVREGLCDPVRLFIKGEPHKIAKLKAGKFRLISGMSIVDQLIDRVLFGCQNELEIKMWDRIPSKPGIGLDDEGLLTMAKWFQEQLESGELLATDVAGWDWSVQEFELDADLDRRTLLCDASGSLWHFLARCRYFCVKWKCFVLPDGSLVAQSVGGKMPSGWYNTSSSNSSMRGLARAFAYSIWCEKTGTPFEPAECARFVAMGDDCVEHYLDDGVNAILSEFGHTLKDSVKFKTLEGIEFCSHRWYGDGLARPVNWVKTLFRFANHPRDPNQLPDWINQLLADFRHMRGVGDFEIQEVIADMAGMSAKDGE